MSESLRAGVVGAGVFGGFHAKKYVEKICGAYKFDQNSQVVEIASNDGYLLKEFVARNIPALGIEPAVNVAAQVSRGRKTFS